jgi:hypothetical protein
LQGADQGVVGGACGNRQPTGFDPTAHPHSAEDIGRPPAPPAKTVQQGGILAQPIDGSHQRVFGGKVLRRRRVRLAVPARVGVFEQVGHADAQRRHDDPDVARVRLAVDHQPRVAVREGQVQVAPVVTGALRAPPAHRVAVRLQQRGEVVGGHRQTSASVRTCSTSRAPDPSRLRWAGHQRRCATHATAVPSPSVVTSSTSASQQQPLFLSERRIARSARRRASRARLTPPGGGYGDGRG